jgi:nicotinate-nucleotide--dimethylbenzimidazole phosphoribosyltransferase
VTEPEVEPGYDSEVDSEDVPEPDPESADPLDELGAAITDPDTTAPDFARQRLGGPGAAQLGRLADLALWWAATRADPAAPAPSRVLLVGGAVDASARPGLRTLALPRGGAVDDALTWGAAAADDAADQGVELILLCLADVEAGRALAADLMGLDAVEASGWPMDQGLSDAAWMDAVVALRDRLRRTRGLRGRPADLLRALDSPATAAAAALLVQATARRTPAILDGPGAAAAALLARRTAYPAAQWWQAAHLGTAPVHERALTSLGLDPLTRLGIRVEDGTAALAGLALLDLAAGLLAGPAIDGPVLDPDG